MDKEIKYKDRQSELDHLSRLTTVILYGGGFAQFKNHWCEEHQCKEY